MMYMLSYKEKNKNKNSAKEQKSPDKDWTATQVSIGRVCGSVREEPSQHRAWPVGCWWQHFMGSQHFDFIFKEGVVRVQCVEDRLAPVSFGLWSVGLSIQGTSAPGLTTLAVQTHTTGARSTGWARSSALALGGLFSAEQIRFLQTVPLPRIPTELDAVPSER